MGQCLLELLWKDPVYCWGILDRDREVFQEGAFEDL